MGVSKPHASSRGFTRALIGAIVTAVLMLAAPAAQGAETLVTVPSRITSFAQDGSFLAWTAGTCGRLLYIQRRTSGVRRSLSGGPPCNDGITIGHGRALWTTPPQLCGNCIGSAVDTASFWHPRVKFLGDLLENPYEDDFNGYRRTGVAADGSLHLFSWVYFKPSADDPCRQTDVACSSWDIPHGRIIRVVKGKREHVGGRFRAALLAVGHGHIAFAPAMTPSDGPPVKVAEDGRIDVRDNTGLLLARVFPTGTALALAVTRTEIAVLLERNDGSRVIKRYRLADQSLVATTPVPATTSPSGFDMSGGWIVYHDGGRIFATDRTGTAQLVLTLQTKPIGLSIDGHRIAWAQNHNGHHKIRAVAPPA